SKRDWSSDVCSSDLQTHIASHLSGIRSKPVLARTASVVGIGAAVAVVFALAAPQTFVSLLPPFATGNDVALFLVFPAHVAAAIIGFVTGVGILAQKTLISFRWILTVLPALVLDPIFADRGFLVHATLSKPAFWKLERYLNLDVKNVPQDVVATQLDLVFFLLLPTIALGIIFSWLPRVIENYGEASGRSIVLRVGEEKAEKRAREERRGQINALTASIPIVAILFAYVDLNDSTFFFDPTTFAVTWIALIATLTTWLVLAIALRPKAFTADRINSITVRGQGRTPCDGWRK